MAPLAPIREHEFDRVLDHRARLVEVLALRVDFRQLRHMRLHPPVLGGLVERGESQLLRHALKGTAPAVGEPDAPASQLGACQRLSGVLIPS